MLTLTHHQRRRVQQTESVDAAGCGCHSNEREVDEQLKLMSLATLSYDKQVNKQ